MAFVLFVVTIVVWLLAVSNLCSSVASMAAGCYGCDHNIFLLQCAAMNITETLNTPQHEAVTTQDENLMILAGAGSGKTRVLVRRVAWLMQEKSASPRSILAVTFTNKAAKEMRERIETLMAKPIGGMWIGTFHGLAHRFLRIHWQEAKLPESFQIIDSEDQHRLIRRVMKNLDLEEKEWPPKQALWYINNKKNDGIRSQSIDSYGDVSEQTMVKVYQAYEEICQRNGLVDFAELLLCAHELWLNNPQILQHYQQQFKYILVDEFQDTNDIQYAWLRLLTTTTNNIAVVGDDDQSIYGWRGANMENVHRFQHDFPNAKIIRLEQNYRSTGNILKAANALISCNSNRLGKNLWTQAGNGEAISLYAAFNGRDEAYFVVNKILNWVQQGNKYNECAILYRANAQSRAFEETLMRANIPYRVYGGMRFFERAEIKNALAYLRLVANENDDPAFERIINMPARGIGNTSLSNIRQIAKEQNISLWQAMKNIIDNKLRPAHTCNALLAFLNLIKRMRLEIKELPLHEQVEHTLHLSGLIKHYQKEKNNKDLSRIENLEELVSATKEFTLSEDEDTSPLMAFLARAALESGNDKEESTDNFVSLMTLHAAKGLEFQVVFLAGMEEGLFPHQMSFDKPQRLEEERRLCYVGITRAMQKLYLLHANSRILYGSERRQKPSRFIYEIPDEHLEKTSAKIKIASTTIRRKATSTFNYSTTINPEVNPAFDLKLGQPVEHAKFGEGVILNFDGDNRVQVRFKKHGIKVLSLEYAKLKPL
jgi:DNA helicase II / ATP-dependent DNA helicase PcrA